MTTEEFQKLRPGERIAQVLSNAHMPLDCMPSDVRPHFRRVTLRHRGTVTTIHNNKNIIIQWDDKTSTLLRPVNHAWMCYALVPKER